jgi:hypothetical protein
MSQAFAVYNYCKALGKSDVLSDRVISWTGRWAMMGSFLMCSQCLAIQQVAEARSPFTHLEGCPAIKNDQYPWQELASLMRQIPLPPDQNV